MLKKVHVEQLRVGMHLHEFCGSWMDHPFWRSKFTLRDDAELAQIRSSGVKEVWIDISKGLDVAGVQPVSQAPASQAAEPLAATPAAPAVVGERSPRQAMAEAAALYRKSIPLVKNMFTEARMGRAIDAESCVPLVDDIAESVLRDPGALINVARLKTRDDYTYMHSVAVCALMVALGRQLGLKGDDLARAGLAGMLHDLGKAVMPLDVLNKPGRLTDEEFAVMRTHPARGHEMLVEGSGAGAVVLDVCLHHHEKIDGSGYPKGLKGDQISLFAKMGAACDVYDAVTSARAYKDPWDPAEALRSMAQWKGHFDPVVFQSFVKTVGIYPVGSLVRLQSGKLAVVTVQNPESLLAPKVKTFFSTKSDMRIEPRELDLAAPGCHDKIVACETPEEWGFKDLDQLWTA